MKRAIIIILLMSVLMIGSEAQLAPLEFNPNCVYEQDISTINPSWVESFDYYDEQDYCLYGDYLYIKRDVFTNFIGEYFTKTPNDIHISDFLLSEQANVRNVEVYIEYYVPSYNGVCLGNSVNGVTGFYNSPMNLLIANHNNGFTESVTFDDAFVPFNDYITTCDTWISDTYIVSNMQNDQGSSFSGRSKTIGTLGVEFANVYIGTIELRGTEETIILW